MRCLRRDVVGSITIDVPCIDHSSSPALPYPTKALEGVLGLVQRGGGAVEENLAIVGFRDRRSS